MATATEVREWVHNKISKLAHEGKEHDQAIAQAISMARDKFGEAAKRIYPERKR